MVLESFGGWLTNILNSKISMSGMSKFSGKMSKVQSMTVDTNVISDMLALVSVYGPMLEEGREIPHDEKAYYDRCVASKLCIFTMLDFDVEKIGLKVVYRELLQKPPLHIIYRNLFPIEAKIDRKAKYLSERYKAAFSIPSADATVVALCATNCIDVLLTWNREHLLKQGARENIEKINDAAGISTPEIITPQAFLDRLMLCNKKLSLNPSPVLPVYRVAPFLSRRAP